MVRTTLASWPGVCYQPPHHSAADPRLCNGASSALRLRGVCCLRFPREMPEGNWEIAIPHKISSCWTEDRFPCKAMTRGHASTSGTALRSHRQKALRRVCAVAPCTLYALVWCPVAACTVQRQLLLRMHQHHRCCQRTHASAPPPPPQPKLHTPKHHAVSARTGHPAYACILYLHC